MKARRQGQSELEAGRRVRGCAESSMNEYRMAERVLGELAHRGETLAVAESCTAGMIGAALTAVPGSSAVFVGGVIAYSNELKRLLLGVPATVLARHGAVSAECVAAMARGVKRLTGATWAVAVSGIAGPGGATPGKPVGLVHIGIAGPIELSGPQRRVITHAFRFRGDRPQVRLKAVQAALRLTLNALLSARHRRKASGRAHQPPQSLSCG